MVGHTADHKKSNTMICEQEHPSGGSKLKLLTDCSSWSDHMNGVKRIGVYILNNIPKEYCVTVILSHRSVQQQLEHNQERYLEFIVSPIKSKLFIHYILIPFIINTRNFDVYWSHNHRFAPFLWSKMKRLMTVHDLCCLKHPQTMSRKTYWSQVMSFRKSVSTADRIITFSQATKRELVSFFPEKSHCCVRIFPKLKLHIGEFSAPKNIKKTTNFLFVGTIEPRKNLERLLRAINPILQRGNGNVTLTVAGSYGWQSEGVWKSLTEGHYPYVKFEKAPSDTRLVDLYSAADAFVMPSIYEGFGIPVLEAMQHSCCIVCSDIPVFRELVDDCGIFFDPTDTLSMSNALNSVVIEKSDTSERQKLSQIRGKRLMKTKNDFLRCFHFD